MSHTDLTQTGSGTDSRILVAYFSATGTTKGVAEQIADAAGGDLYEIVPEAPYTTADLNYTDNSCRANREQNDPAVRPAMSDSVEDLEQYDVIFLGYPIWHGQPPRIISTFLESGSFDGKTIVPFCTSGGSGFSNSGLPELTAGASWLAGRRFSSDAAQEDIEEWIGGLDLPDATKSHGSQSPSGARLHRHTDQSHCGRFYSADPGPLPGAMPAWTNRMGPSQT